MDRIDASELPLDSSDNRDRADNGRAFSDYLSTLLLIFGSGLVLFHVVTWILVIIEPFLKEGNIPPGAHQVPYGPTNISFWEIVSDGTFRTNFFVLILGVILVLVAVHLKDTPGWNRIVKPLVYFIALNVVVMTLGLFASIFVPEVRLWEGEISFFDIWDLCRLLVQIVMLIAIMIVEMPPIRNKFVRLFKKDRFRSKQEDEEAAST